MRILPRCFKLDMMLLIVSPLQKDLTQQGPYILGRNYILIPVMLKQKFNVSFWQLIPCLPTDTINLLDPHYPIDEFWGTMCGCTSEPPPSSSPIWDHCEFLRRTGLYFHSYLGFFVCLTHGYLIHPFHLISHLKASHNIGDMVGRIKLNKGGWVAFKGHIKRSFKVQLDTTSDPSKPLLPKDWAVIEVPVPGLPVILGFQCLQCNQLQGTLGSIKSHFHTQHGKKNHQELPASGMEIIKLPFKDSYSRVPMQACFKAVSLKPQLFATNHHRQYLQVMHVSEKQDPLQPSQSKSQVSSRLTPPSTLSGLFPSYISALGWIDWLREIQSSQNTLRWLVSVPQDQRFSGDEVLDKVEHGLWKTSQLLKEYLRDAEQALDSMTPSVRDAIRGR